MTYIQSPGDSAQTLFMNPSLPLLLKGTLDIAASGAMLKYAQIARIVDQSTAVAFAKFVEALAATREAMNGLQHLSCNKISFTDRTRVGFGLRRLINVEIKL